MMRLPYRAPVLLPLLLASACARYTAGSLDPAAAPAQYAALRLDDPTLQDSVRAYVPSGQSTAALAVSALFARRDLAAATARLLASRGDAAVAGARPPIGLDGQLERLVYGQSQGAPWVVGLTPTIRLETGGKRAARRLRALAVTRRTEMELRLLAWAIVSDVRTRVMERQAAEDERAAAAVLLHAYDALVSHAERRRSRGEVGEREVARWESERRIVATQAAAAERASADAEAALWRALGVAPSDVLLSATHATSRECTNASDRARWRQAALQGRYEIGAALADYATADADVRSAVAQGKPDLAIAPGFVFDQSTNRWTLGIGLPEIRLDGNKPAVRAAELHRRAAEAAVAAAQTAVLGEVDEAFSRCIATAGARTAALQRVAVAEMRMTQARAHFARGEVGAVDTLVAAAAIAEAQFGVQVQQVHVARAVLALDVAAARWTSGAPSRWPSLGIPTDSLAPRP